MTVRFRDLHATMMPVAVIMRMYRTTSGDEVLCIENKDVITGTSVSRSSLDSYAYVPLHALTCACVKLCSCCLADAMSSTESDDRVAILFNGEACMAASIWSTYRYLHTQRHSPTFEG